MGAKWFIHIQVFLLMLCLLVLGFLGVTAASGNWQKTLGNLVFFAGVAAFILAVNLYFTFKEKR